MSEDPRARFDRRASVAGLQVDGPLRERLVAYYELLLRWNRKINLTSLADSDEAVDRLLLEPVAASAYLPHQCRLVDLGSGGGSPALPLAMAIEAASLVMVESRTRKAAFLREAARTVSVPSTVLAMRLEDLPRTLEGSADLVSIRAIRADRDVLEIATRLTTDGPVALFVSRPDPELPASFTAFAAHRLIGNAWLVTVRRCST
jgi:16S rRNA (guanine527-N7)-methyltransferase